MNEIHDLDDFSFDAKAKTLTAEASDLGFPVGSFPRVLSIRNSIGRIVEFKPWRDVKDPEGDLLYVDYQPVPGPNAIGVLDGLVVRVLND